MSLTLNKFVRMFFSVLFVAAITGATANAEGIPPELEAKVKKYEDMLAKWASDPDVVSAVKSANSKGGIIKGMTNIKWDELPANDSKVTQFQKTKAAQKMDKWQTKDLAKLFLRDSRGDLVAGPSKPLIYNIKARPPFKNAQKGKPWHAPKAKPDPSTGDLSVQVSVPVMEKGKVIGVLHTAVKHRK
ncbi:MAG: hypothetical protein OEZ43_05225 [Gammaproteobacteria bacterium]|nr:hypothetical protein [Gammaproteobacteria bacterium]